MRNLLARTLVATFIAALPVVAGAQLVVAPINGSTITPASLANSLLSAGSGITINNVTYTGANGATGTFSGGAAIVGIGSGVLLTSGSVNSVVGPNNDSGAGPDNGLAGDSDLDTIAGTGTFDASVLTITFTPTGNQIQFSYVFGSEEYNEYVGSAYNDPFGFLVNGTNRALLPGTSTPVTINNVNCGASGTGAGPNCTLFVNNPGTFNTQLDGFTRVLSFTANVNPGVPNTLKIAIGDASDRILDSAVFIAGGSLSVCGGAGQPACGAPPVQPPPTEIPTLSEWALILLAVFASLIGMGAIRRRG